MSRRPQYAAGAYVPNTVKVTPFCYISSAYGQALGDETLEDIATVFLGIDAEFVGVLETVLKTPASRIEFLHSDSPRTLQQDQAMISDVKAQIGDVKNAKYSFHEHYLRQRPLLGVWQRSSHALLQMLDFYVNVSKNHEYAARTIICNIEQLATPLNYLLLAAAIRGVLGREDRAIIRLRMLLLDEMLDIYHRRKSTTRTLKTWSELQDRMALSTEISQKDTGAPLSTTSESQNPPASSSGLILWCTIMATSIVSIPIIVKAYQFSPHEPGTWSEADAWFLLQSSGMQVLNLVTAFILTSRDKTLHVFTRRWMLAVMVVAACCVLGSLIIYSLVPKEWSSMLACVAPIVQAFVLAQLLFETKRKRD